ncbi:sigma-E processing peptidase SpoIIGA [Mycoplasmatota bacterium WC44]
MILYLDLFFLVNIFINYLFFEVIGFMMSLRRKRIVIGSILLSIITLISLWIHLPGILRYSIGLFIIWIVFGFGDLKQFISLSFVFYLMNLSLGGLTFLISQSINMNLVFGGIIITISFFLIDKLVFDKKLIFEIEIEVFHKKINTFIDTGNLALIDGLSICFMNTKYINNDFTFVKKCRINTITGSESIDLYKAEVRLKSKEVNCYIAFKDNIPFDAMISPYLLKFKGGREDVKIST